MGEFDCNQFGQIPVERIDRRTPLFTGHKFRRDDDISAPVHPHCQIDLFRKLLNQIVQVGKRGNRNAEQAACSIRVQNRRRLLFHLLFPVCAFVIFGNTGHIRRQVIGQFGKRDEMVVIRIRVPVKRLNQPIGEKGMPRQVPDIALLVRLTARHGRQPIRPVEHMGHRNRVAHLKNADAARRSGMAGIEQNQLAFRIRRPVGLADPFERNPHRRQGVLLPVPVPHRQIEFSVIARNAVTGKIEYRRFVPVKPVAPLPDLLLDGVFVAVRLPRRLKAGRLIADRLRLGGELRLKKRGKVTDVVLSVFQLRTLLVVGTDTDKKHIHGLVNGLFLRSRKIPDRSETKQTGKQRRGPQYEAEGRN